MSHNSRNPLHKILAPGLGFLALVAMAVPTQALATPFVVRLVQQANRVVAIGSGAIDLTGLTPDPALASPDGDVSSIMPYFGDVSLGPEITYPVMKGFTGFSGPENFGLGGGAFGTSGSGDIVEITGNPKYWGVPALFVQDGYVSDAPLFGTAIVDHASFSSLGVNPGTYVWRWGPGADQSFTLTTQVPEPAALGMFGLGLLLVGGFVALRRRGSLRA